MNGIGGRQHGIAVPELITRGDSLRLLTREHVLGVRHMMRMRIPDKVFLVYSSVSIVAHTAQS